MKNIQWRPYQQDCFNAIYDSYKNKGNKKQLIVQATGLGKRLQSINITTKFSGRSLFLAHSEELIDQAYNDMIQFHNFTDVGIIKGPKFEVDKRIIIASPQTLFNRLSKISKNHFQLVQVDEVHRYLARTFCNVVNHFDAELLLGWTATPYRLDGLSLNNLFDDIVFEYNIAQGIENGYLCYLDGIRIKTEVNMQNIHRKMGDFAIDELSNLVDIPSRNDLIVESYIKYADKRQAIGFCVDIMHCNNLKRHFDKAGISCDILVSDETICPDRKGVNERFRSGQTRILLNVQMLIEGWDYADVGCILMARPTQSLSFYMQAIGRGARIKSEAFQTQFGSNDCKILDFVDNSGKHSLVNTWNLDSNKSAKDKVFVTPEKRSKLIAAENNRKNAIIDRMIQQDSKINLLKLPETKFYDGAWTRDEASPAQIEYLKKLELYEEGVVYTKGMCSELISNNPAQPWQLRLLSKWGYDVSSGNINNGQYSKVKQKLISDNKYNPHFNINTYKV